MLGSELRHAARALLHTPVFSATAVITLALGIGASTAIFSVTNAVLLRPLPYRNPDRLVLACADMQTRNVVDSPVSAENFIDLRNGAKRNFEDFGAVFTNRGNFPREDGTPEQVRFAQVTTNFFALMGAKMVLGRDFTDSDGQPQPAAQPGAAPPATPPLPTIAVLSYEYWQRRYGGNPAVLGRPMLNNAPGFNPQIVGVLAPGFELLFRPSAEVERHPDIWIAARLRYDNANRNAYFLRAIGRVKPGVTLRQAQEEVDLVSAEIRRNFSLYRTARFQYRAEPMKQYMVAEVRPAILALMGAVIFLLLIACANVANLLLVRVSLRERELAVRAALGGGRWRLVRQMLTEALLLTGFGTLLGVGLAWLGIHELLRIAPPNLPRLDSVPLDPQVLAFTVVVGALAAAIFGIVPALRASRPDVMNVLRASGRTVALGSSQLRSGVVVVEVALSFVLLIGSGLMFRSFLALQHTNLGFDPHQLLTFGILGGPGNTVPQQRAARMREIQTRLRALPGVESATGSFPFPLAGGFSTIRWGKEEAVADPGKYQAVDWQVVLPGYFDTLRTPLLAGRTFTEADNIPERNLVVMDQVFAAKAFPGESAVGKRILIRLRTPEPEWVEIIGIVAHQRQTSIADPGREQIYFTDGFLRHGNVGQWAIRTSGDPAKYAPLVRAEIAKVDPHMLINDIEPMDTLVEKAQAGTRFSLVLIGVFATIAGLLAAVGLYGVLSTVVRQRTAEIGVRMALGAAPRSIFNLVVGHGLRLTALGIVAGIAAALGLTRAMITMLIGVKPTDPPTFASIVVVFFLIAALACLFPAHRAARLDPTMALREE
ncbi:MAG TPA: ABC transporter permease [Bryobacteraceae bacterium]|nr:ABC transporter permease [Bryobacteraceae bacterium]